MLSDSSDGPYMSDIAMQPSPTTETTGPFFPSWVVFTIRCFLRFGGFDDRRHIPYNVTMDRNKAWLQPVRDGTTQPESAQYAIHPHGRFLVSRLLDRNGFRVGAAGEPCRTKGQQNGCGFYQAVLICNLEVAQSGSTS